MYNLEQELVAECITFTMSMWYFICNHFVLIVKNLLIKF